MPTKEGISIAQESKPKCTVDPGCGIDLTAEDGKFAYDFEEETYYFCSELCRDQFAAAAAKFLKKEKS
ncbi:MAG: hypothetical protein DRG58_01585 [Deltaproteobacteria bacterium]|nr:MAG: hypothetical protein DRG58_01585 [Deltaproteobacteria bacterium]